MTLTFLAGSRLAAVLPIAWRRLCLDSAALPLPPPAVVCLGDHHVTPALNVVGLLRRPYATGGQLLGMILHAILV